MTEPQNAPKQPAAPSSYPAYDPAADDKLLYSVAAVAVALPLAAFAFFVFASKGSKAPFRFGAKGLLDKTEFNDYLKTGSFRANATVKFKHPVEKIWQVLTGEHAFSWLPGVKGVHYVGTPGEGAVRYLKTLPLALGEQVVEYDEGKVFGYTGTGASLPVLKHLASQYNFEPTKRGGTKVTWKLAATPKFVGFLPLWLAGPLAKPALKVALRLANSSIFPADKK